MNGTEIALIITAVGTLVAALGGVIIGVRNTRAIKQVHESTNGKMDKLLAVTGAAEKAKGVMEGLEQGRGETR